MIPSLLLTSLSFSQIHTQSREGLIKKDLRQLILITSLGIMKCFFIYFYIILYFLEIIFTVCMHYLQIREMFLFWKKLPLAYDIDGGQDTW